MSDMKEQQKKMLEALERRNENLDAFGKSFDARIESVGKSFGEGMQKLDEHADDLLKLIDMLEFSKQIFDEKLRKKISAKKNVPIY